MLNEGLIAKVSPLAKKSNTVYYKDYRITILCERLFRIERNSSHDFNDEATQSIWFRDMPVQAFSFEQDDCSVRITTKSCSLYVFEDFSKSFVVLEGKKRKLNNQGNLLGTARTLDCFDGDRSIRGEREKTSLCNGVCSRRGVAVIDDTHSLILKKNGELAEESSDEMDCYVFAFGHDYKGAVQALYKITGNVPLIPKFALGNWWSRYYPYTEKQYVDLMEKFKEEGIPLTVATVDMDWHYSNKEEIAKLFAVPKDEHFDENTYGWTGYTWNERLFPDYKRFLNALHQKNLRVTLNLHPADGLRYWEPFYAEMCKAMEQNAEEKLPVRFDIANPEFINHYMEIMHHPYEKEGVDFWWIDWQQGTSSKKAGLDPLWALNHYHYLDNAEGHAEPLILSRFCGVGSHRYPLGFSGDTIVSWKTQKYIPYFTTTAANIGYGWWSHDVGGHVFGEKDDEIFLRFVQYAVFNPIMRLHSSAHEMFTKEPWTYKNGIGDLVKKALILRHKLIPFLYSVDYKCHTEGQVLCEPLYYYYPEEENAYRYKNQYIFGGELLICPICKHSGAHGLTETKIWLPKGRWTDIFTGEEYEGGRCLTAVRWLDSIPVFAKAGAILPTYAELDGNSIENPEKLELSVFNGNGVFALYEDKDGEKQVTEFAVTDNEKQVVFFFTHENEKVVPTNRSYIVRFRNIKNGDVTVNVNGKENACQVAKKDCISVTLTNLTVGDRCEIFIEYQRENPLERAKRYVKENLVCIQGNNDERKDLYNAILAAKNLTDMQKAVNDSSFTAMEKIRLLETI